MGISSQAKGTTMASSDSHVTIVPYFTVPEGKMDAFKAGFADFYKHTKEGTGASGECLYYGFAQEGNKIFCREGYKSAAGVLAHLGEAKASELAQDSHVTIVPYFTVPEGKMDAFKA